MKRLACFALLAAMASPLSAAIIIAGDVDQSGAPCTLTITTDLTYTLTSGTSSYFVSVVFKNLPGGGDGGQQGTQLVPQLAYSRNGSATVLRGVDSALVDNLGFNSNDLGAGDTFIYFNMASPLSAGETLTIRAGTYDFLGGTGMNPGIVGTFSGSSFLGNGIGGAISDPITVPEPSAALLGGVGALALLRRRR